MASTENNNKNAFVQARDVVNIGIKLLQKELTIANLFFKNAQIDWSGRPGDSVTVRVEQPLSAARRFGTGWRPNQDIGPNTNPVVAPTNAGTAESPYDVYADSSYGARPSIRVDTVTETTITLTIDEFIYKALGVTLEDLTLNTPDFAQQNLSKMVRVVAERIEQKCLTQMAATNWYDGSVSGVGAATEMYFGVLAHDGSDADAKKVVAGINSMRRALTANFVPVSGRTLVVGTNVEDAVILSDKFQRYDSVGSDSSLREATTGRILNSDVVVNATIDPDTMYMLSPNAFLLHTVTPRQPDGAVQSGVASGEGLSLMYVQDYDNEHMIDRVVTSMFAGTSPVEDGPLVGGNRTMVRAAVGRFAAEPEA